MKRFKSISIISIFITIGIIIITYIPYFSLKQYVKEGVISYVLYKNPIYHRQNIAVKTEPYVRVNITESSSWKWIITLDQKVYLSDVLLKVVDKDTDELFASQQIPITDIQTDTLNNERFKEVLHKASDNYPYREFFPYISATMIASYSGEPKIILITKKINRDASAFLKELDDYLKQKHTSISVLEQQKVVFIYSEGIYPSASLMQE